MPEDGGRHRKKNLPPLNAPEAPRAIVLLSELEVLAELKDPIHTLQTSAIIVGCYNRDTDAQVDVNAKIEEVIAGAKGVYKKLKLFIGDDGNGIFSELLEMAAHMLGYNSCGEVNFETFELAGKYEMLALGADRAYDVMYPAKAGESLFDKGSLVIVG